MLMVGGQIDQCECSVVFCVSAVTVGVSVDCVSQSVRCECGLELKESAIGCRFFVCLFVYYVLRIVMLG